MDIRPYIIRMLQADLRSPPGNVPASNDSTTLILRLTDQSADACTRR